ncbi:MAG TPA: hypothetical protein VFY93_03340 [Planctomycetota bacterium]|nr:hypothetical protein [Planctomycetota bacterium]
MSKAISYATIALAVAPGIAAWVIRTSLDFEWLVFLGTLALLGAILALGRPLPRGIRLGAAAFAALALLGTTGLRMRAMAAIRPFSAYTGFNQKDLTELTLPVASEGESFYDAPHSDRSRVILTIDIAGAIVWKQRTVCLAEVGEFLERYRDCDVLLRLDQDVPFLFLGWLGVLAAEQGHAKVLILVERFARSQGEARDLDADYSREYWPALALPAPITGADGPALRILATGYRDMMWPPMRSSWDDGVPRHTAHVATRARYVWDGRETDDLRELAGWIRSSPPARIEADPEVPVKYVVAAENEIRKAGHPPAALVLPPPPHRNLREARFLPYPLAR